MFLRVLSMLFSAAMLALVPAAGKACDVGVPNTHLGEVTAIDAPGQRLSLRDAQSGKILTFAAPKQVLSGLAVRDQVSVEYATEDKALKATAIKKN